MLHNEALRRGLIMITKMTITRGNCNGGGKDDGDILQIKDIDTKGDESINAMLK